MFGRVGRVVRWEPLRAGEVAPQLSLTADDGTWIKLADFKTHLHVLLVFFRAPEEAATDAFLKELNRNLPRLQALEVAVFGVSTYRTDQLRAYRAKLGIEIPLLYDPFAWESRGFRASGRLRPFCRPNTALIGRDGRILLAQRGYPEIEALLAAAAEGRPIPPPVAEEAEEAKPADRAADIQDIDSKQAIELLSAPGSKHVLVDVRTRAELEREHSPLVRHHIPVDEIPHRYFEIKQTEDIIFVCAGGGRSAAAGEFMTSIGSARIYNVVGGMSQWEGPKVSGPLQKGDA